MQLAGEKDKKKMEKGARCVCRPQKPPEKESESDGAKPSRR